MAEMEDADQERFEDYLELERYIEALQAGQVAHPPKDLTPEQVRIYQMAALFHAASEEHIEPRPEFAEELHARLLALEEEDQQTLKIPVVKPVPREVESASQPEVPTPQRATQEQEISRTRIAPLREGPRRAHFFSRRSLLAGGAVAAASIALGAGIESAIKPPDSTNEPPPIGQGDEGTPLVNGAKMWLPVTTLAQLGSSAIRFATNSIVGYVIRDRSDTSGQGVLALSASCTHMGCLINWQDADRQFHCPCHDGVFTESGMPGVGRSRYLTPLPQMKTRVEDGKVYVEVPKH